MTTIQLTTTQAQVLQHALDQSDGRIEWFPDNVKGGARKKVLDGLLNRALITSDGGINWFIAAEGYDALGRPRPTATTATTATTVATVTTAAARAQVAPLVADPEMQATVAQHEAQWAQEAQVPQDQTPIDSLSGSSPTQVKTRTRENSKQAVVVQMLKRLEGATVRQICEATGWQAHTVRGTFAGAFKKKLGLTIGSDKALGAERVYRIA